MSTKWMKALILLFLAAVLLTVACVTTQRSDSDSSASEDQPVVVPSPTGNIVVPPVPTDDAPGGQNGWVTEDGKNYYYLNGVMQKDTVVGSDAEGYFYVNAEGVRDDGLCNALTINGTKWNVIEGKASRVEDEWDECLHTALGYVGQWTDSSMTREQKLRKAFDTIKRDDVFLEGVPDRDGEPYYQLNWPVVCANELLVDGMGDCFSYGAAFAFIGQAIGYDNCYACTTGGHGWAEIDGKAYDPEWDAHHQEYNHFGVSPGDDCDVAYFTSLTEGVDWMYVNVAEKIPASDGEYGE